MVRTALALARRGLAVFPCRQRAKLPATEHGVKDATRDPARIAQWWQNDPTYNVAIATGAPSGVFALDIDGVDAEAALCRLETEHGSLPPSVEVITARGRHIYFRMPATDIRNSAGKVAAKIDVRGTGGYVLAPPSIHPSGHRYCWSVDSANAFADAPGWLVRNIIIARHGNCTGAEPPSDWATRIATGIGEGVRDDTLTRLAGYLLRRYVAPDVVLELLQACNATKCAPPLPDKDVERIVRSISQKAATRRMEAPRWLTSST
jgi:Bifunctional DNA primase/polymerase, N-terminal/Primase C terminal 1 (PriCT-1)